MTMRPNHEDEMTTAGSALDYTRERLLDACLLAALGDMDLAEERAMMVNREMRERRRSQLVAMLDHALYRLGQSRPRIDAALAEAELSSTQQVVDSVIMLLGPSVEREALRSVRRITTNLQPLDFVHGGW